MQEQNTQARRFRFCLGGANVPPKQNQNFLTYFLSKFQTSENAQTTPTAMFSQFRMVLLEKNEIVIEY